MWPLNDKAMTGKLLSLFVMIQTHGSTNNDKDPVMTRAESARCARIQELCNSTDKLCSAQNAKGLVQADLLDDGLYTVFSLHILVRMPLQNVPRFQSHIDVPLKAHLQGQIA